MAPEIDAQPKEEKFIDEGSDPIERLLTEKEEEEIIDCGFEKEPPDWRGMKPQMEIVVEGVSANEIDEEVREQIEIDIIDYLLTSTGLGVEGVTIPCRD